MAIVRINWFLVSLAYFTLFVFGLIDNVRGPVFPDLLKAFSLTDTKGSLFFFVASTAALLNNLLLFKWMEKLGAYRVNQVYAGLQFAGVVLMGVAPVYEVVLVGAALMGTALGGLGISVNLLVAQATPSVHRRQTLSGLHCMYGVASLTAPLIVSGLYFLGLSWNAVLGWSALGSLAVLILSFFGKPNKDEKTISDEAGRALRSKRLAFFYSAMNTCYVIAEIAIATRLALYVRRDVGYSFEDANFLLSGFFLGLFLGRLLFAVVKIPLNNAQVLMISAVMSLVFFSLGLTHSPEWLALTGLSLSAFYPCSIALINDELDSANAAYTTSWSITLQSLGLMLMHLILGQVSDWLGLGWALWLGPVCLAFVIIFLLARPRFLHIYLGKAAV